jgi:Na+-translocating ferredoxin:NAD+ oxidoreductase subunit G
MTENNLHTLKVGIVLAVITAVCLTLVFTVSNLTHDAILVARDHDKNQRFIKLLPKGSFNNSPIRECYLVPNFGNEPKEVYIAKKDNVITGYVINYDITGGYSTPFKMIAGVTKDGEITYIDIVETNETPGLGDKILRGKSNFLDTFTGVSLSNRNFEVKKYGGDFDYFTGATVTPRAVVRSTKAMLEALTKIDITSFPQCPTKED